MRDVKSTRVAPPSVPPTAMVKDVVDLLVHQHGCALAVVDGRKFLGTLSKGDIVTRVVGAGRDPATTPVSDVMSTPDVVIRKNATGEEALRRMTENEQCFLPVTDDDGCLTGWLAVCEMYQNKLEDLSNEVESLVAYMSVDGPGG